MDSIDAWRTLGLDCGRQGGPGLRLVIRVLSFSITLSIQNQMSERKVALNGACVQGVTLSRNSVLAEGMKTREAGEMSQ